ncbi:MAG: septum formation protein Maf [Barnesiella sp.]|nr:septum formation protein Maf [Barnesiella sp.]
MVNPLHNLSRYRVLLASGSPRRKELLAMLGVEFTRPEVIDIPETYPSSLPAVDVAEYLAVKKAEAYKSVLAPADLCITADTVVILGGEVLGKPDSEHEARRMLRALSGKTHQVTTGVAVTTIDRMESFTAITEVTFADLTDDEIDFYIARYSPMDKAGAYGIQEWIGCIGISGIEGSFYNVMGLPLHRLYSLLLKF